MIHICCIQSTVVFKLQIFCGKEKRSHGTMEWIMLVTLLLIWSRSVDTFGIEMAKSHHWRQELHRTPPFLSGRGSARRASGAITLVRTNWALGVERALAQFALWKPYLDPFLFQRRLIGRPHYTCRLWWKVFVACVRPFHCAAQIKYHVFLKLVTWNVWNI